MGSNKSTKSNAFAAVLIGLCVAATVFDESFVLSSIGAVLFDESSYISSVDQGMSAAPYLRRQLSLEQDAEASSLLEESPEERTYTLYPWARRLIRPLTTTPEPERETALFWHIPKSGGSTVKQLYKCMGKKIDVKSRPAEILESKELGLIQSGEIDLVFSSFPGFAIEHLVDSAHKVRALGMFRHPVDRLVSKFYYLQIATWERTYNPAWKDMDILEWAKTSNMDNDHMVKKLAGKLQREEATEKDLALAKQTIKMRFVVGLMDEMEESIKRFNVVMGIDTVTSQSGKGCMNGFFGVNARRTNSNPHPKMDKDNPAWQLLAEQNSYDVQLYEYIVELFDKQKEVINSYASMRAYTGLVSID